jgi:hypothetical protein
LLILLSVLHLVVKVVINITFVPKKKKKKKSHLSFLFVHSCLTIFFFDIQQLVVEPVEVSKKNK